MPNSYFNNENGEVGKDGVAADSDGVAIDSDGVAINSDGADLVMIMKCSDD